jgi:hypothetical protein
MPTALAISCSAVILCVVTFRILTYVSKRRNRMTGPNVADIIENHLNGIDGPYDWDQFTSAPIADQWLDQIRVRSIELDVPASVTEGKLKEWAELIHILRSRRM